MNSYECHQHAADCAANAGVSQDEAVALEFLQLAAHWRAMAVRQIFLGNVDIPVESLGLLPPAPAV
jgi:hypothetical protein